MHIFHRTGPGSMKAMTSKAMPIKSRPIKSMRGARVFQGLPLWVTRVAWVALALAAILWAQGASAQVKLTDIPMPELRNQSQEFWINSKPLTKADLKGSVVLIEVWTSI